MAYDSRYRVAILIASMSAVTTALVAAFDAVADAWSTFTESILALTHAIDWPAFRPEARESIALDTVARELVDERQPGIASRFVEFGRRALLHPDFTAGHFDPGRMPA